MSGPRWSSHCALALLAIVSAIPTGADAAGDGQGAWRTDFAAAQAEAEREQKPLLVHFSAIWCPPCSKMDREVLKSPDVKHLLGERYIGVKIDADQHQDLMKQFGIQLLPSDIVIDPHNGRVLLESQGSADLKKYLSFAARGENVYQHASKVRLLAKQKQPETIRNSKSGEAVAKDTLTVDLGTPRPPVGLDGFSPVALSKSRKWVRGSAEYAWDYQGVTYQLATREELAEFRKDPAAFAPRLLGCDPVLLWETDRAQPGRTLYGAFFDDELYLFTSAENRKRFKANPQRFTKTQHVLKVDQIDRTAMVDESHWK